MANIFISYRRDDSIAAAGRIRDRLVQEFGRKSVFVDVDDIPHGQDFKKVLNAKVAQCNVLLAIIGPTWANAKDDRGQRRLDNPEDFVGIEIGSALERGDIALIPVLIDGALMPPVDVLPDRLKPLVRRNAIELRNTQFGSDADRLIRSIKAAIGTRGTMSASRVAALAIGLAVLVALIAGAAVFGLNLPSSTIGRGRLAGDVFRDCSDCPEMTVVPAGQFVMGASANERSIYEWARPTEAPVHEVRITQPFAAGRFTVTRNQYEQFVQASATPVAPGCNVWNEKEVFDPGRSFRDPGFSGGAQAGDHPVVCVSHSDAAGFAAWLSRKTGHSYRLLSDAEREYIARAGTATAFWWGSGVGPDQANYHSDQSYNGGPTAPPRMATVAVKSFLPNPWGLYQVHGNVAEWVADCWHPDLAGSPSDGSVWQPGVDACKQFTIRNGAFMNRADFLRSAHRGSASDIPNYAIGFRVARSLAD